jgi:hypothetical protein
MDQLSRFIQAWPFIAFYTPTSFIPLSHQTCHIAEFWSQLGDLDS